MCVYLEREKNDPVIEFRWFGRGLLNGTRGHVETHGALGRSKNTWSAAGVGASKPDAEM